MTAGGPCIKCRVRLDGEARWRATDLRPEAPGRPCMRPQCSGTMISGGTGHVLRRVSAGFSPGGLEGGRDLLV